MEHAVSLVQAYLQLNGYFTLAEFPVMRAAKRGLRSLTDIDILAFRFPTSSDNGQLAAQGADLSAIDPDLGIASDRIDMIIGEVKEGRVGINTGAIDPSVLRAVLRRFGYAEHDAGRIAGELVRNGSTTTPNGYQVRLVAFGAFPPGEAVPPCRIISLGHVLDFLQRYVREHWHYLRHCHFRDPAFGFLMTLEKARRGGAGRRGRNGVEVVSGDGRRASRPRNAAPRRHGRGKTMSRRPRQMPSAPRVK